MRAQARAAEASAARNATIAGLARRLLSCSSDEQIAKVACRELGRLFDCNAVLMTGAAEPQVVAARPSHAMLTPSDIARRRLGDRVGRAGRARRGGGQCHRMGLLSGPVGLGGPRRHRPCPRRRRRGRCRPDQLELLDSLVDQVALALERSRLEAEARGFAALRERDRVRSALLSSIGQDLEPRLSAIAGGVDELQRSGSSDKALRLDHRLGSRESCSAIFPTCSSSARNPTSKPLEAGDVTIDLFRRVGVARTASRSI